jgi:FkbM family methyltransferase
VKQFKFFKNYFKTKSKTRYLNFLELMISKGYVFETVYDIGALQGSWSKRLKKRFPFLDPILFEANPIYQQALANSGFRYFNVALSSPDREYVEFFNGSNSGDSYYKETTKHYDKQSSIRLKTHVLDEIVSQHSLAKPNFIKIDTQGSELDILRGGIQTLRDADFVFIECPIIEYNFGAPNISDYLSFFKEQDFVPYDIYEIHRAEDTLLQIDIMFIRKSIKERYLGPYQFIRI